MRLIALITYLKPPQIERLLLFINEEQRQLIQKLMAETIGK
jgi:hypothetical protein